MAEAMTEAMKAMAWFDPSANFSDGNGQMFRPEEAPKRHAACDECSKFNSLRFE